MNEPQHIGEYLGYAMIAEGISVSCPRLKLRGYRDELDLARAIYRTLNKRSQLPTDAMKPAQWFDAMVKASR